MYRSSRCALLVIVFISAVVNTGSTICNSTLGFENGNITDSQITASGSYSSYAPHKARLNSGIGWAAYPANNQQYLQVDLLSNHEITAVSTQGITNGWYTRSYRLYFSLDGRKWENYNSARSDLLGETKVSNKNNRDIVTQQLVPPIKARYIAINPVTYSGYPSLRIELYGCPSADILIPQQTNVTSDIVDSVTWIPSQSPYVVDKEIHIRPSANVTIQAGVSVVFTGAAAGLTVHGNLKVEGIEGLPSLFTSSTPTSHMKWKGISLMSGGKMSLNGVHIRHAETGVTVSNLDDFMINKSAIYSCGVGLAVKAGSTNKTRLAIKDLTMSYNGYGMKVHGTTVAPFVNIDRCKISGSSNYGIYAQNWDSNPSPSTEISVRNSLFNASQEGIVLDRQGSLTVHNCTFAQHGKYGVRVRNYYWYRLNVPTIISSSRFEKNKYNGIYLGLSCKDQTITIKDNLFEQNVREDVYTLCDRVEPGIWYFEFTGNILKARSGTYGSLRIHLNVPVSANIVNNTFMNMPDALNIEAASNRNHRSDLSIRNNIFSEISNNYVVNTRRVKIEFTNNTLVNCSAKEGVMVSKFYDHEIHNNKFLNGSRNHAVVLGYYADSDNTTIYKVDLSHNYWGSSDPMIIRSHVYDIFADVKKGYAIITPYYTTKDMEITSDNDVTDWVMFSNGSIGGILQDNTTLTANSNLSVTKTIIVPENLIMKVDENVNISFPEDVGIIIQGKLFIHGSEQEHVNLVGKIDPQMKSVRWHGLIVDSGELSVRYTTISNGSNCVDMSGIQAKVDIRHSTLSFCKRAVGGAILNNNALFLQDSSVVDNDNGLKLATDLNSTSGLTLSRSQFTRNRMYGLSINPNFKSYQNSPELVYITINNCTFASEIQSNACPSNLIASITNNYFETKVDGMSYALMHLLGRYMNVNITNNRFEEESGHVFLEHCNYNGRSSKSGVKHIRISNNEFNRTRFIQTIRINTYYRTEIHEIDILYNQFTSLSEPARQENMLHYYSSNVAHILRIEDNVFTLIPKARTYAVFIQGRIASFHVKNNVLSGGSQALYLNGNNNPTLEGIILNNTIRSFTGYYDSNNGQVVYISYTSDSILQVKENLFIGNNGTVVLLNTPDVLFYGNSFENPNAQYNIKYNSLYHQTAIINASYNYWGTTDSKTISQKIYDQAYQSKLAQIIYIPYLGSRNTSDISEVTSSFLGAGGQIGGAVNGNVTLTLGGSPYVAIANIEVSQSDVLIIEAGVKIYFQENIGITVVGSLLVLGNSTGQVEMLSQTVGKKWRGIEFTPEYDISGVVDLRLVGGSSPNEGRVEVYYAGQWGTVCDDGFQSYEAKVVCRMLGYDPDGVVRYFSGAHFGQGTGPIWLDDLGCTGLETHLRNCKSSGWGNSNCNHGEDAGVRCEGVHRISKRQAEDTSILKPRGLMARQSDKSWTVIIVEWEPPLAPVDELTGYEVVVSTEENGNIFTVMVSTNVTSSTLTNLEPNTVYFLTVTAMYDNSSDVQSDVLIYRTAKGPKSYTVLRHLTLNDTTDGVTLRGNILEVVGLKSLYSAGTGMTVDFDDLTPVKYLDISDVTLARNSQNGLVVETATNREESNLALKDCSIFDNALDGIRINGDVNMSVEQSVLFGNKAAVRVVKTLTGSIKMYSSHFYRNSEQVLSVTSSGNSRHYNIEIISCNIREHNTKHAWWSNNIRPLIYASFSGVPKTSVLISNNFIRDNFADGIQINHGGGVSYKIDIVNNLYVNNSYFVWINDVNSYPKGNITLDQNSVRNCKVRYNNYPLLNFRIADSHLVIKNFTNIFNNSANNIIEISEISKDKSRTEIYGNDVSNNNAINTINLLVTTNVSIHHNIFNNSVSCELTTVDFIEGASIDAMYNYWGHTDLLSVIPRVCGFDKSMGKVRVRYIPYLEELEFFPKFNAYISSGSQEDFYIGNIKGGEVINTLTLTQQTEPYIVDRSIYVRPGSKLIIDRNVTVFFKEGRGIYVKGSLVLNGEEGKDIKFLSYSESPWYGIVINSYNSFNFYGMYDSRPQTRSIYVDAMSYKSEVVVAENSVSVTLPCYASSTPEVKYKWEKRYANGTTIVLTDRDRYTVASGGLTINRPSNDLDEGLYRCSVYNDAGFVLGRWTSLAFALSGDFANIQPAPVMALQYEGVLLECPPITLTHPEVYEFRWRKDSQFIFLESGSMFISKNGNLYISEALPPDQGQYVCVLVNKGQSGGGEFMASSETGGLLFEKSSQPIDLRVQSNVASVYPPIIHDDFIQQSPKGQIFESETVVLECFAYGSEPLQYIWTVPSGANSQQRFNEGSAPTVPWEYERLWLSNNNRVLRITNARLSDSGQYNCTVKGRVSSDSKTFQLTIEEKLKLSEQLDNRRLQPNTNTSWVCNASGPANIVYKWYHDGQPMTNSTEEGITINNNILTITKLNAARHNGVYQCIAADHIHTVSTHALLTVFAYGPLITGIRLVDKNSSNSGRVEVEHAGMYGRVLDNYFTWKDASVICRMLGYDPAGGVSTYHPTLPSDKRGKIPIWIRNFECDEHAISLEQCSTEAKWGEISENGVRDVGVTCLGPYIGGHNESETILNRVTVNNSREGFDVRSNVIKFSRCIVDNTTKAGISVSYGAHILDLNGTYIRNSGEQGMKFNNIQTVNVRNVTIENASMEGLKITVGKGNVHIANVDIKNCSIGIYVIPASVANNFTIENSQISNSTSQALQMSFTNYQSSHRRINVINNLFYNNTKGSVKIVITDYSSFWLPDDVVVFTSNKFVNSGKIYFNLYNRHSLLFRENELIGGNGIDDKCLLEVFPGGNRKYDGRKVLISGNTFTNITGKCVVYFEKIDQKLVGLFEYNRLFDNNVQQGLMKLNSEFYNITFNRFYNPDVTYDLVVMRKGDTVVNGTKNWWGSADLNRAKLRIFDQRQQSDLLKVNIEPILTEEEFDCSGVNNCSGKGECVKPNGCRCNSGWTGQSCSDFDCAGVNGCYGNGICVGPNTCQCSAGWTGSFCTIATCFSVNNCSSRGVCILPDQCLCIKQFAGADCSSCSVNRWGPSCLPCPACVNGVCDKTNGMCICDSSNWAGDLCDRCNDTFYGPRCLPYINILNIIPATGVDNGNTLVHVWGHNFPETTNKTYYCHFGSKTVQGQWISREHVTCVSPKQSEGNVFLEISEDGISFTNNRTIFTYYATCPPSACGRDLQPPRGQCLYGNCVCIKPYVGQDCTIELLKPVIIPISTEYLNVMEGYFWSVQLNVTQGSKPLQWRLYNGPPGLEIDQESGLLEWSPTVASSSPHVVTIMVSNSIGQDSVTIRLQAIYSYNVTVTDVQALPMFDSVVSQSLASPTPVKIYGHINIFDRSSWNERLASVDVKIRNKQQTKTLYAYTDPLNKENFETTYYPRPDDSGRFSVGATHPSDSGFTEQIYWSVLGMKTDPPSVYKTAYLDTSTVVFRSIGKLVNTGVDRINNIHATIEGIGGPLTNGHVTFPGQTQDNMVTTLDQGQEISFDLVLNASSPLRGTIAIIFSSDLGTTTTMRVRLSLSIRTPLLTLSPSSFSGSVVRGTQKNTPDGYNKSRRGPSRGCNTCHAKRQSIISVVFFCKWNSYLI